jgi:hypothetical protein
MSEGLCDEACIFNHRLCPDGDIKSFLNHIYGSVSGFEKYGDLWIRRHVPRKRISQTSLRQKYGTAEANHSRWFFTQFRHTVVCGLRSFNRHDASIKEVPSGICQGQSAGGALEQTDTEPLLERRDASTQARFLNTDDPRGGREATMLDD